VEEQFAHTVGTKLPNPWGLYGMHGNVMEWCRDFYDSNYYRGSPNTVVEPLGPPGDEDVEAYHILRGGSFRSLYHNTHSAYRYNNFGASHNSAVGTRLVKIGPRISTAVTPQSWGQTKRGER